MKAEDIQIGKSYYMTNRYSVTQCFRVIALEVLNKRSVKVRGTVKKKKKNATYKEFSVPISALHKTPDKAVQGYLQHHPNKRKKKRKKQFRSDNDK